MYEHPHSAQPRKSNTGLILGLGCLGLVLLAVLGSCGVFLVAVASDPGGGSDAAAPEESSDTDEEPAEDDAEADDSEEGPEDTGEGHAVGDTFEHGSFEFTVHEVERGLTSIEDEFGLTQEARGEYIVVHLTAENTSSSGEYLEAMNQVLMDDEGRKYDYDISATVGDGWLDRVNPGQSAETALAYDVPDDAEITHMLVNGATMFDDGERVDID